ncbi:MAG: hypothetical protein JW704_09765 [Anaerolineaceae bacterium]|nr:hypothetical protein [Anaerolineaceae bacterium]
MRKRAARREPAPAKDRPNFEQPSSSVMRQVELEVAAKLDKPNPLRKKDGQTGAGVVNWYHVQAWFIDGIKRNNKGWLVVQPDDKWTERSQTWWGGKEKANAGRLLKHYGEEILHKTVAWFCDNWQGIKDASNGRLGGAPTVNLLWAARDRFFAEALEGKRYKPKRKKHMVGEYDANTDTMPNRGWGPNV